MLIFWHLNRAGDELQAFGADRTCLRKSVLGTLSEPEIGQELEDQGRFFIVSIKHRASSAWRTA